MISEDTSAFYDSNNDVTLSPSKSDKEVKERKRLSAVGDYRIGAEESNKENVIDRKVSKGNIFTSLKSGVKAVFQGRKVRYILTFNVLILSSFQHFAFYAFKIFTYHSHLTLQERVFWFPLTCVSQPL